MPKTANGFGDTCLQLSAVILSAWQRLKGKDNLILCVDEDSGLIHMFEKLAQIREKARPKKENVPDDMPNLLASDDMISFD